MRAAMADVQWFYARDDKPMGPVSPTELKHLADSGELRPDDLLWREGMEAWTTAINLQGLFSESATLDARALAASPRSSSRPVGQVHRSRRTGRMPVCGGWCTPRKSSCGRRACW